MPRRLAPACGRQGCRELKPCPNHSRDTDRDRERHGTRYTPAMRRAATKVRADAVGRTCPRCGLPIEAGQPVDAGHSTDRASRPGSLPDRPEHAACNRSAGGKLTHRNDPPPF